MHSLKCLNKKRLLSTERRRFRFGENTLLGMLAIMSKRVHNQKSPRNSLKSHPLITIKGSEMKPLPDLMSSPTQYFGQKIN